MNIPHTASVLTLQWIIRLIMNLSLFTIEFKATACRVVTLHCCFTVNEPIQNYREEFYEVRRFSSQAMVEKHYLLLGAIMKHLADYMKITGYYLPAYGCMHQRPWIAFFVIVMCVILAKLNG